MINTITLNPALDHILYLDMLERNITNRLSGMATTMGGKGTHVSMNLAIMGCASRAYGFSFGKNGRKIIAMLEESGVTSRFVQDDGYGESRDNYLIVEERTKDATLIASKGPSPASDHLARLYAMMESDIQSGESIALSGDTSNFPDPMIYNRIAERLMDRSPRIFLDASGPTLERALALNPFLIKPNLHELSVLLDRTLVSEADLVRAIEELDQRWRIEAIVISLGGDGAAARIGDALYRVRAPQVDVYNTVGCGDCMLAGLLHGFERNLPAEALLRYATGCSAATAESPLSVGFDLDRAQALMEQTDVVRM